MQGGIVSKETREKLSKIRKGKKFTEEHKKAIREGCKGINKGCKHTDETKQKISDARKGLPLSEAAKIQLSKTLTGKKFSEERKQKLKDGWAKRKLRLKKEEDGIIN